MIETKVVSNYGWVDTHQVSAHAYLESAVIETCERLGAKRVLDLGCGNGALTHALARAGFDVLGCDADEAGIALARQTPSGAHFKITSVYDEPSEFGTDQFDVVVSVEVIEHLFSPRHLPRFARGLLKDDGHLVVTTPYHGYLKNLALSVLNKWDSHHSALWDGGHIKFWSRATLTRLLEDEHFTVEQFRGVGRVPLLWKSMLLTARKI